MVIILLSLMKHFSTINEAKNFKMLNRMRWMAYSSARVFRYKTNCLGSLSTLNFVSRILDGSSVEKVVNKFSSIMFFNPSLFTIGEILAMCNWTTRSLLSTQTFLSFGYNTRSTWFHFWFLSLCLIEESISFNLESADDIMLTFIAVSIGSSAAI